MRLMIIMVMMVILGRPRIVSVLSPLRANAVNLNDNARSTVRMVGNAPSFNFQRMIIVEVMRSASALQNFSDFNVKWKSLNATWNVEMVEPVKSSTPHTTSAP